MIPIWRFNTKSKWLEGTGFRKGVCTKVFVMAPRKPNSGQRKVTYVRLSNGRIVKAYIPGMGHNLQVHSVVMVRGGAKKDTDGCNYTCMRGKYDLLPVKNRKSSRSKYAVKKPADYVPKSARLKQLVTEVDRKRFYYKTGLDYEFEQAEEDRGKTDYTKDLKTGPLYQRIARVVGKTPPTGYRNAKGRKKPT